MALKGLLDAVGEPVTDRHGLNFLWGRCKLAIEPKDPPAWNGFATDHLPLIEALDAVDPTSYGFRYPVDNKGQAVTRPRSSTCRRSTSTSSTSRAT
jgi:hypothetical protein